MDVSEKLVELLNEVQETGVNEIPAGFGCTREYVKNEKVASHLIAHGVTVQEWISVKDGLPEEHDCFFTSFYGTEKWQDGMFLKCSNAVLASVEYEDGKIRVKAIITKDGKWDLSKLYRASKVTHWMPLPQPPKGE